MFNKEESKQRRCSGKAIAFYAPLKSPDHPIPSGDRKIARLFISALEASGYNVELASRLRTFDKKGDVARQQRIITIAEREAERILRRWRREDFQPIAWFSYHLYYKAPDLIGPIICRQLNIPYLLAEASWAAKRERGGWSLYHQYVDAALQMADSVLCINPTDLAALHSYYQTKCLANPLAKSPVVSISAFIDAPGVNNSDEGILQREEIASQFGLVLERPWLIVVAMMRSGDKFKSYQLLATALGKLEASYQLLVVGRGEMHLDIEALFNGQHSVHFAGALENDLVQKLLPHFEILIWPAINEAIGMVFLEAQQAGVAVVAGDQGGVSSVVADGESGLLVEATDTDAIAKAIDSLLADPVKLNLMQRQAKKYVLERHSIAVAANQLKAIVGTLADAYKQP
ncbi:MAG: glycosyltransferase family 4 protein [Amphritea sp.]